MERKDGRRDNSGLSYIVCALCSLSFMVIYTSRLFSWSFSLSHLGQHVFVSFSLSESVGLSLYQELSV